MATVRGMRGRTETFRLGDLIRERAAQFSPPAPNEGVCYGTDGRTAGGCVTARPKWKAAATAVASTQRRRVDPSASPANPRHVETRPRLMCHSFHVVEQGGTEDLVETRQSGGRREGIGMSV